MSEYRYRYIKAKSEEPLTRCPECGAWLTADEEQPSGGIGLVLSVGGHAFTRRTRLEDGWLVDTEDGAVAKGFHSTTECHNCGEGLCNMEDVCEEQWDGDKLEFAG